MKKYNNIMENKKKKIGVRLICYNFTHHFQMAKCTVRKFYKKFWRQLDFLEFWL